MRKIVHEVLEINKNQGITFCEFLLPQIITKNVYLQLFLSITGLSNPLDMIYWIQPSMIIGLLPLTLLFEVVPAITNGSFYYSLGNDDSAWTTTTYIISGSLLAFFMELSEYLLLTYTSSLTLSIAGIFKEVFTLYLAVEYNGDTMSLINLLGLGVCVTGISLHVLQKAIDASGGKVKDC